MLLEMYILIVLNLTACKRTNLHGFLWCLMNICFLTLFLCLACQYSLFSEYCSNFDTFGPSPNSQFCCDIKVTRKYDPCHNEVTIWPFSDDNFELSHGKIRKYLEYMKIYTLEPKSVFELSAQNVSLVDESTVRRSS